MSEVKWVKQPGTAAPDNDKPFVALSAADGAEQWVELATDKDVDPADLDFRPAQEWAQTQQAPQ